MLNTESTLVRAFTKRRTSNVVRPPPAPLLSLEAVQRREAALRQMGLLPALSLSQQEAQLDCLILPTSPVDHNSEADRIKNEWVAKNQLSLPPSPPLTPSSPLVLILPPTSSLIAGQPLLSLSPISDVFLPPESPSHLPSRSRSPSLAGSDSKSTRSRSRAKSPLRFFTPAPPQRKKTVFARFKRSNTVDPSSLSSLSKGQSPSRSKSLFTSLKLSVFGTALLDEIPASNPITVPSSPNLTLPTVSNDSTLLTTPPTLHSDPNVLVVLEGDDPAVSIRSSAELPPDLGKIDFPLLDGCKSDSKGTRKGISILILNRERSKSASPSTPPASPLAPSFLSSPPASPTTSTPTAGLLRGRLGRKGTIGAGSDALLTVWGGVAGLLAGASSVNGAIVGEGEERQAVAPTIHNQASILHHMSNIEDEETRRVTELAFM